MGSRHRELNDRDLDTHLKGTQKKGGLNAGNLGTNYAKKSASLQEMVNDKIELHVNFHVV